MLQIQDGQCGLCAHFGKDHSDNPTLVQIRVTRQAPDTLLERCGHPRHAALHLIVTPVSACDGFAPLPAQKH